jgi:hypothetical protein
MERPNGSKIKLAAFLQSPQNVRCAAGCPNPEE